MPETTSGTRLELTQESLGHIEQIRKWTMFLSILGFIFVGLCVLVGIGASLAISLLARQSELRGVPSLLLVFFYPVMGLIYFFPIFYLYRFSVYAKQGLQTLNSGAMALALGYLRKHYTFIAILTIIAIALIPLAVVIAILIPVMMRG